MLVSGTATLQDAIGLPFVFQARPIGWISEGRDAVYAFAARRTDGTWVPYYIGRADDLAARLADHDRLDEAIARGATHLLFHIGRPGDPLSRAEVEARLVSHYEPPLNDLYAARSREVLATLLERQAIWESRFG